MSATSQRWILALGLVAVTLVVFLPVRGHDFIRLDDDIYVLENPVVREGLSAEGMRWAWSSFEAGNWHPVTWLSHMLDVELYGLDPAGHHGTNLLLHLANVLLVFFLLAQMTDAPGRSAAVAALFAVHPLHVESVAWVAERKDLLSSLFGWLAVAAYLAWTRRPTLSRHLAVTLLLGLGLASKPMLVTFPVVLLLLDVWPLDRAAGLSADRGVWTGLVREKIPWFAMVVVSSAITVLAQRAGGAVSGAELPLLPRLSNAIVAAAGYLGKLVWPFELSVLYPHPYLPGGTPPGVGVVLAATAVLGLVTFVVVRSRRPWAWVCWAGYGVTLLPVIGVIQVGTQAMADRYTYVPLLGPMTLLVWGGWSLSGRWLAPRRRAAVCALVAVALVAGCGWAARLRVADWKDSITLFESSLAAAPGSPTLHNDLGIALGQAGREDEAEAQFEIALALYPEYPEALFNLGMTRNRLGRSLEAIAPLHALVEAHPDQWMARGELARALAATGRTAQALEQYEAAIALRPDWPPFLNAAAWIAATSPDPAVRNPQAALRHAQLAVERAGGADATTLDTLAAAYASAGQFADAVTTAEQALTFAVDPRHGAAVRGRLELYRKGEPFVTPR